MRWRLRLGAAAIAAGALAATAADGQPRLTSAQCDPDVAATKQSWRVAGPSLAQPALTPGGVLRHWPTEVLGTWVVEDASQGGAVTLIRVSPAALTRRTWGPDCRPTDREVPRAPAPAPSFTDADLTRVLAATHRGVFYLWSPHMPLSVDGYAGLAGAAQARGLSVEALLDPQANRAFAVATAAARGLPDNAARVVDSVELQFRELALHAPSLAVFADGQLLGPVLRGYRTGEEYAAFVDRVLPSK